MTTTKKVRFIYNIYPGALWASENPVLLEREIGIIEETGEQRWGDGVTHFNDLPAAPFPATEWGNITGTLSAQTDLQAALDAKAPLASPALTGAPTGPTASPGTNNTQLATTAFVAALVSLATTGLLDLKGDIDCSANPNYPAASKGDAYVVSVAGKIGGASGVSVDIGDTIIAKADNAGGTQASVGSSWWAQEHNIAGALIAANNLSDVANAATARSNLVITAANTPSTATGNVAATNVQAAIAELDTEKAPILSPNLTGNPTHTNNVSGDIEHFRFTASYSNGEKKGITWHDGSNFVAKTSITYESAIGRTYFVVSHLYNGGYTTLDAVKMGIDGIWLAGTKVLATRKTGWSTATGTATRTSFDTSTVTLSQLAERLKALIDDLHAAAGHGLIGT